MCKTDNDDVNTDTDAPTTMMTTNHNNDDPPEEEDNDHHRHLELLEQTLQAHEKPVPHHHPWPEEQSSHTRAGWNLGAAAAWWTRLTYSYMNPLLHKGSQQTLEDGTHLSEDDLFRVPTTFESSFLEAKFERLYAQDAIHHKPSTTTPTTPTPTTPTTASKGKTKRNGRLLRTLWHLAAPTFLPAGVYELMTVLCQVGIPLLVREILRLLEEYPAQSIFDKAWPYVVGVFVALSLNALANHRHRYLATQSGIVLRSTIVSVIYSRVLQLSCEGRQGLASGEVTNMVAIDTQKLFEVTQEAHLIWAMPLSIVLVTICLYIVLGPTTLIGVVVLLCMVPIVERVASAMLSIRQERIKLTDKRVEISNAMIQGVSYCQVQQKSSRVGREKGLNVFPHSHVLMYDSMFNF